VSIYCDVCAAIAENTEPWGNWERGQAWERTYRLDDKYICSEDDSGTSASVYYENSTALIWVMKGGQLGLKGRSIPHMELLVFYKKGKPPPTALLVPVTQFHYFQPQ
jgi:hypothetical protein